MSFSKLLTRAPFLKSSLLFLANFFIPDSPATSCALWLWSVKRIRRPWISRAVFYTFLSQETKALLLTQNCLTQVLLSKSWGEDAGKQFLCCCWLYSRLDKEEIRGMADSPLQQKCCPHFRITVRSWCPPALVGYLTRNSRKQNHFILEKQNLNPRCLYYKAWCHLHSFQFCSAQVLYLSSQQGMLFPTAQWLPWHTCGLKNCSTSAVDLGNFLLLTEPAKSGFCKCGIWFMTYTICTVTSDPRLSVHLCPTKMIQAWNTWNTRISAGQGTGFIWKNRSQRDI